MNKRGLSNVITTVLIILIAIAAVVLVWGFVKNTLVQSGSSIGSANLISASMTIPAKPIVTSDGNVSVLVKRNSGTDANVTGVLFLLYDSNGDSVSVEKNDSLSQLQSKRFTILNNEYSGLEGNITKISVAEIVNENGKELKTGVLDSYQISSNSGSIPCVDTWQCGDWSTCDSNSQNRTCTKTNNCSSDSHEPALTQTCTAGCTPHWVPGNWSACVDGSQSRTFTDTNNCGVSQPEGLKTTQDCTPTPVCGNGIVETGEQCDGSNLGGATCASVKGSDYTGTLSCSSSCQFDVNGCTESGSPPAGSGDPYAWPEFMHDSNNSGYNALSAGPVTKNILWSEYLSGYRIYSNIIAGNGKVYVLDNTGQLHVYDASTGTSLPGIQLGSTSSLHTTPLLDTRNKVIYVNGPENIYKIDVSGTIPKIDWIKNNSDSMPSLGSSDKESPIMDSNGDIYFVRHNKIYKYDSTGQLLKSRELEPGNSNYYSYSTPAIYGNYLIIRGSNYGRIYFINKDDFTTYKIITNGISPSGYPVSISGLKVYYASSSYNPLIRSLWGYNGLSADSTSLNAEANNLLAIGGGNVYVGYSEYLYSFSSNLGTENWKYSTTWSSYFPVVSNNSIVYIGDSNEYVYAVNTTDGKLIWRSDSMNGEIGAPATIYKGVLYVPTYNGHIYAFGSK